jgi:site-specific DNA-methyltransferase (adenine-specific)
MTALMFYGWTKTDAFFDAWKDAGFQPVGHIVFRKAYSSKKRFFSYQHEQAYLLAKGRPRLPKQPLADVQNSHWPMLWMCHIAAIDCTQRRSR